MHGSYIVFSRNDARETRDNALPRVSRWRAESNEGVEQRQDFYVYRLVEYFVLTAP